MAEAFLRKHAGDQFEVYSGGLEPKPIHPMTIQVMEETGVDMSGQTSKPLAQFVGKAQFDFLITLCSDAEDRCPVFPGMGTRLHWPFEDPAAFKGPEEERLARFREIRDQIDRTVIAWLVGQGIAVHQ